MVGASYIKGARRKAIWDCGFGRAESIGSRVRSQNPKFRKKTIKKNGEVSLSDFGLLMRVHYGSRKTGKA
jgi:hypothetical protein